jgi:nucleoside-diphosphate-sugar epimerase
MRVFLAGATGVIGSPLVPQLLEAGHQVTAMTRSVLRAAQLETVGADPVVCDVFDADGVRAAMADASPEAVIHQLTALPPRLDWGDPNLFNANNRVRTEGTRILVDAALATGASRVVAQSIAFAYAPTGDRVKEEGAARGCPGARRTLKVAVLPPRPLALRA